VNSTDIVTLMFQDHWMLTTILWPNAVVFYALITKQWGWAVCAMLWNESLAWAGVISLRIP